MSALVERLKRAQHPVVRLALLRLRATPHLVANGHAIRRRTVAGYLDSAGEPKLQIGAGPLGLPGWLNSDLISGDIYLDLTRELPMPGGRFSYAFGEHVIEHLPESTGMRLLTEMHRILRPGGVLRLTTPDLQKMIAIYQDANPVVSRDDYARYLDETTGKRHERPCQVLNDYLRLWGHQYVYDEEDLTAKLRAVGFGRVERVEPGQSAHSALRGLERHGGAEWVNRAEAMCLEATRSAT